MGFIPPRDSGGGDHYAFVGHVQLSADARSLLKAIAGDYYIRTCGRLEILSGTRAPKEQARAMWANIYYGRNRETQYRDRDAYNEIMTAYQNRRRMGASEDDTIAAMTRVVEEQVSRGQYISLHLRGEAVDVRSRTMLPAQRKAFEEAVQRVLGHGPLEEEDHYHVQF